MSARCRRTPLVSALSTGSSLNPLEDQVLSSAPTFADLIALAKADQDLSDSRRRHVVSDLRSFVREAGRQPAAVPATVAAARELIQAMRQRPLGVVPKRWSNIRASVSFALARYCGVPEQHWEAGRELQGPWRELRDRITDMEVRIQLSRLFRYCALHGIAPDQVSAATFAAFRVWLEQRTTVIDPAGGSAAPAWPGTGPSLPCPAGRGPRPGRCPPHQTVRHAGGPPRLLPGRGRDLAPAARRR